MRLAQQPRIAGCLVGVLVGLASWVGNAERTDLGIASAFPDVLTIAVVPLALYFFVRARVRVPQPPTLRTLRRAGWSVVNTAAIVVAFFLASVTAFWFHQPDATLIALTTVNVVIVTVGVGYLSVEIWSRMLPGSSGGSRDRHNGE